MWREEAHSNCPNETQCARVAHAKLIGLFHNSAVAIGGDDYFVMLSHSPCGRERMCEPQTSECYLDKIFIVSSIEEHPKYIGISSMYGSLGSWAHFFLFWRLLEAAKIVLTLQPRLQVTLNLAVDTSSKSVARSRYWPLGTLAPARPLVVSHLPPTMASPRADAADAEKQDEEVGAILRRMEEEVLAFRDETERAHGARCDAATLRRWPGARGEASTTALRSIPASGAWRRTSSSSPPAGTARAAMVSVSAQAAVPITASDERRDSLRRGSLLVHYKTECHSGPWQRLCCNIFLPEGKRIVCICREDIQYYSVFSIPQFHKRNFAASRFTSATEQV